MPTPVSTLAPTPTASVAEAVVWKFEQDIVLNVVMGMPDQWSLQHRYGTTILSDGSDEERLYLREYDMRDGAYSAESLISRIRLPANHNRPFPTSVKMGASTVYDDANLLFIEQNGRLFSLQHATQSASTSPSRMYGVARTLQAPRASRTDNYQVISSANWIAELRGGGTITQTLTLERRDGAYGYLIYEGPPADGLGYALERPLFFSNDERFLYFNRQSVADGCGLFPHSSDVKRFEMSTGEVVTLDDTSGTGHVLSAENTRLAFARSDSEHHSTILVHSPTHGATETYSIPNPNAENGAGVGSLLFSPNGTQIAFALVERFCGDGLQIGILDLADGADNAIRMFSLADHPEASFHFPVAWQDDVIVLRKWGGQSGFQLDVTSGDVVRERQ